MIRSPLCGMNLSGLPDLWHCMNKLRQELGCCRTSAVGAVRGDCGGESPVTCWCPFWQAARVWVLVQPEHGWIWDLLTSGRCQQWTWSRGGGGSVWAAWSRWGWRGIPGQRGSTWWCAGCRPDPHCSPSGLWVAICLLEWNTVQWLLQCLVCHSNGFFFTGRCLQYKPSYWLSKAGKVLLCAGGYWSDRGQAVPGTWAEVTGRDVHRNFEKKGQHVHFCNRRRHAPSPWTHILPILLETVKLSGSITNRRRQALPPTHIFCDYFI